jgi:hypothetical protein
MFYDWQRYFGKSVELIMTIYLRLVLQTRIEQNHHGKYLFVTSALVVVDGLNMSMEAAGHATNYYCPYKSNISLLVYFYFEYPLQNFGPEDNIHILYVQLRIT